MAGIGWPASTVFGDAATSLTTAMCDADALDHGPAAYGGDVASALAMMFFALTPIWPRLVGQGPCWHSAAKALVGILYTYFEAGTLAPGKRLITNKLNHGTIFA
jgi:hypothetical protein